MKIAIEAQRIFRTNKHGMDFVALEAIRQLQQIDRTNQYYILVSPGEDRCLEETSNFRIVELKCPTYPLWEQVALPRAIRKIKPDLLHCTSNTAPIYCSCPLMVTLHDIIFLEKRQASSKSLYQNMGWYYRRFVVPRILPKCKKIITVSRFERGRIIDALHLTPERVQAVYNGYSAHFKPVERPFEITRKYLEESSYLFFLGNTDPKKNTARVLAAYAIYLDRSSRKLPLLIADLKEEVVVGLLHENGLERIKPYLRYSGYIRNSDLPSVYSGAFIFLYPSLRESFGIPILESMACGTPLITSDTSSMPEIAGHGALLIDPRDPQQIADNIMALENDPALYTRQAAYGLERVKQFSWRQTAVELLAIYGSIVESDRTKNRISR